MPPIFFPPTLALTAASVPRSRSSYFTDCPGISDAEQSVSALFQLAVWYLRPEGGEESVGDEYVTSSHILGRFHNVVERPLPPQDTTERVAGNLYFCVISSLLLTRQGFS